MCEFAGWFLGVMTDCVFQRWPQQYLLLHVLFLQCALKSPPIKGQGQCPLSLDPRVSFVIVLANRGEWT